MVSQGSIKCENRQLAFFGFEKTTFARDGRSRKRRPSIRTCASQKR